LPLLVRRIVQGPSPVGRGDASDVRVPRDGDADATATRFQTAARWFGRTTRLSMSIAMCWPFVGLAAWVTGSRRHGSDDDGRHPLLRELLSVGAPLVLLGCAAWAAAILASAATRWCPPVRRSLRAAEAAMAESGALVVPAAGHRLPPAWHVADFVQEEILRLWLAEDGNRLGRALPVAGFPRVLCALTRDYVGPPVDWELASDVTLEQLNWAAWCET